MATRSNQPTLPKSLSPERRTAYEQGYHDYLAGNVTRPMGLMPEQHYQPVAGYEQDYDAGWNRAVEDATTKSIRSTRWGMVAIGISAIIVGIGLLFLAAAVPPDFGNDFGSRKTATRAVALCALLGAMAIVGGMVFCARGLLALSDRS